MRSLIVAAIAALAFASATPVLAYQTGGSAHMGWDVKSTAHGTGTGPEVTEAHQCRDAHGHFTHCPAPGPKHCRTGYLCGDTCISRDKVCHMGGTSRKAGGEQ